jgi:hypothetical protein
MSRHFATIAVLLSIALALLALPTRPAQSQSDELCFNEVAYCISGRIRDYWEQNGGLPVFGFPISPQQEEMIEGTPYQVQWFERNRLELHPENTPPYDVLLGRLGVDMLEQAGRDWFDFAQETPAAGCIFFEETQHNACGDILAMWQANGLEIDGVAGKSYAESLALFGLPVSPLQTEVIEGQQYQVQWFERARFELHPENDPPYHVLLGLLGNELRQVESPQPTTPTPPVVTPSPTTPTPQPPAPSDGFVAHLDFAPVPDGFSFQNFGNDSPDYKNKLTSADLIKMFGAERVCVVGSTASSCVLSAPARQWLNKQIEWLDMGHCEGMAVTSLRFLLDKPFKGKQAPADFQAGAGTVYDLMRRLPLENYIAYYASIQLLDEVYYPAERLRVTHTPADMVDLISTSLQRGTDPYTLAIFKYEDGYLTRGHAITPFAVEQQDDETVLVHVYDNNFPTQTRYVEINTRTNQWRYDTTVRPDLPVDAYVGDASTQSLFVRQLSLRDLEPFTCPFCRDAEGFGANQTGNQPISFALYGEGAMLITNSAGERVGTNPQGGGYLNEIAGVELRPFLGGLGKAHPPAYRFTQHSPNERYTITLSGQPLGQQARGDLAMTGAGLVAGFEEIVLDPNETVRLSVRRDGRELAFTAGDNAETPALFFAVDGAQGEPGYLFTVDGVEVPAAETVTLNLDLEAGQLTFRDSDGETDTYDVEMVRINTDGSEDTYVNEDVPVGGSEEAAMEFGTWEGEGDEMEFDIDDAPTSPYPAP